MSFISKHPARIYAVAVAALALVAHYRPELPGALVLGLVAAVLGIGEAVQRTEDQKTATAGAGDQLGNNEHQDHGELPA
ncbi:hypothetical protein OG365_07140 [Streptomyces sp. NBC_00853]|uniref:hypothetical protein n=1 Tax=Streptomyces sp. NBC_00853 TaxID=2903681 RepID=UPI003872D0C7|nr:hypothetical protein OG365_07140 [Streptomyces sp. NBC_00853]